MNSFTLARVSRSSWAPSVPGLLVVDSSWKPVYLNSEAFKIFTYPHGINPDGALAIAFPAEIRAKLLSQAACKDSPCMVEFASGRRHYQCRPIILRHSSGSPVQRITGLLMERSYSKPAKVSEIAEQFRLTHREKEIVELLTLGLTSKEIATRMNVSPNTVKTYFRLIMGKMAVSTRSGIVGKIARA